MCSVAGTGAKPPELVLASSSAARANLLQSCGICFVVKRSNVAEPEGVDPSLVEQVTQALADAKATSARLDHPHSCIVGCDTLLVASGMVVGKFKDGESALDWWTSHQGDSVRVVTAQCVIWGDRKTCEVADAHVRLGSYSREECSRYLDDKANLMAAGAFRIQSIGAALVERVAGDPTAVIGLSLPLLRRQLRGLGLDIFDYCLRS